MSRHTFSRIPVTVVAVLALVVAAVGTTTAGYAAAAITKAQVKKIAKKQAGKAITAAAPTLSVASATTATTASNATNLNGQPATAYQDNVTVYNAVFAATAGLSRQVTIPLAPGNYQIGYSAFLVGGSGYSYCQVRRVRTTPPGTLYVADDTSQTTSSYPSTSAVGVVDVLAGDVVRLYCESETAISAVAGQPWQIIVTPLDSVTNVTTPLTAPKGQAGGSRSN